jgi:hypothetical protein
MIQRIQTLYLFMTTILPLLFHKLKLLRFTDSNGRELSVKFNGIYSADAGQALVHIRQILSVSVILILIPVLSMAAIFLFRKRKLQMKLTLLIILLAAGLIIAEVIYSLLIIRRYEATIIPGFVMIVPLLILIFSMLAYTGIKKDENLIRSYDRLR